jgi:hypothetical protein
MSLLLKKRILRSVNEETESVDRFAEEEAEARAEESESRRNSLTMLND